MPNVAENLQERLQSITQQIVSRSRLLHIVDELNLYPKEHPRLSPDDIVESMRKNIDIELVRGADNRISAFNVYYTAADPVIAQRVTSKLTNLFINENLEVRQQRIGRQHKVPGGSAHVSAAVAWKRRRRKSVSLKPNM